MKLALSLTHRCNLAYRYCYAGRAFKQDMPLRTAQKAVEFALRITPPGQTIEFCFFGGEPFFCFDEIREITVYIRQRTQDNGNALRLSVTTNGTILTQPLLDFLHAEAIDLCISLDGPQPVHDLNRRYGNGRGSFTDVTSNLQKALATLNCVQVNAVYGPDGITNGCLTTCGTILVATKVPFLYLFMVIYTQEIGHTVPDQDCFHQSSAQFAFDVFPHLFIAQQTQSLSQPAVAASLAHLSPVARQISEASAVLSPCFAFDQVRQVAGRREMETMDGLDELSARHLLLQEARRFYFRHDLVRRVVFGSVNPVRRQLLRRRTNRFGPAASPQ